MEEIKEKLEKENQIFLNDWMQSQEEKVLIEEPKSDKLIQKNEIEEVHIEEQIANLQKISYQTKKKRSRLTTQKENKKKRDYVAEAKSKVEIGKRCEQIIYEKEKENLIKQGKVEFAKKVEWISQQPGGDGKGYDIVSYRKCKGKYEKIYIEVKGTVKDYDEPFEISSKEVEISEQQKEHYYLYRVAKANTKAPIYYEQKGSIREWYDLEPTNYRAIKKKS